MLEMFFDGLFLFGWMQHFFSDFGNHIRYTSGKLRRLAYEIFILTLITASTSAAAKNDDSNDEFFAPETNKRNQSLIDPTTLVPKIILDKSVAVNDDDDLSITPPKVPGKILKKYDIKRKKLDTAIFIGATDPSDDSGSLNWQCPNITITKNLDCGCDIPHTLRCSGDYHGLEVIAKSLRESPYMVSLLDCTLRNVTVLSDARIFENISLHGLVISSGEIKRVHKSAFLGLSSFLQVLGLPNNALVGVPWNSLTNLITLERLDLSGNKIKALGITDFSTLTNLNYLELTDNQVTSISSRTFTNLKRLEALKLGGNRLGDYASSLQAIGQCINLRQLDLRSNSICGPLNENTLPALSLLETLNLERNSIKSIQNKALQNFPRLISLSLRHNQIDVLQDHAFFGLNHLQVLDLSYNGIVAVSGASLQHLARLISLDLTHNFLRALTSDLILPLPSLQELRLNGNDISIVAKNAMEGAKELISLSLQENPLSCDCSIRTFAEWFSASKVSSHDLLGATCATPPHLEGAPLYQIPMESLSCELHNSELLDNANILEQLEAISKQNSSSSKHLKDLSEKIFLRDFHFSMDYGLILTWTVNLNDVEFSCDAIYVYKETKSNEALVDNSPIHCESKKINGQNTVSVIVPESSQLENGESYRFCLVLVQEKPIKTDLVVGCSNATILQTSDKLSSSEIAKNNRRAFHAASDVGSIEKMSSRSDEISNQHPDDINLNRSKLSPNFETTSSSDKTYQLLESLNKSFLPGLGLGILLTSVFVLIWGAAKLRRANRPNPTVSTCYAASDRIAHISDPESGNRYLKLQATTSL